MDDDDGFSYFINFHQNKNFKTLCQTGVGCFFLPDKKETGEKMKSDLKDQTAAFSPLN